MKIRKFNQITTMSNIDVIFNGLNKDFDCDITKYNNDLLDLSQFDDVFVDIEDM